MKPGMDYSQLDDSGIVKVGTYVDENTILVGRYMELPNGKLADASEATQVWTHGRVESVVVLVNNKGLRTIKVRCVEYRVPELGDKFSNRHGQKGTIGMVVRSHDLPRTMSGVVPDMIMNTHAIRSRMTIGHVIEMVLGKIAANVGAIADGTAFTDDGRLTKQMCSALEQLGFEKFANEIMYDGISGKQLSMDMFIGPIFSMRLKHMVEDKWNARGKGRREQRTHQPTGGRGAQGGLRIGEMERDAILGHGISAFTNESYMLRSDGTSFNVCKGCGTIPIENERKGLFVCPLCTGPVKYIGSGSTDLELVPPMRKTIVAPVKIEMPYAFKLLCQELETYMNIGMRIMTEKDLLRLTGINKDDLPPLTDEEKAKGLITLPERVLPETVVAEYRQPEEGVTEASPELLMKLGAVAAVAPVVDDGDDVVVNGKGRSAEEGMTTNEAIGMAASAVANGAQTGMIPGAIVQTAKGPVFQPSPTNVTIVPPAKTIQVVGGPEAVTADEDLGAGARVIPNVLPAGSFQGQALQGQPYQGQPYQGQPYQGQPYQGQPMQAQPFHGQAYQGQPGFAPQGQTFQGQPYGVNQGLNMGSVPAVYAASLPSAQMFNSGVPGAPPTFAVPTDDLSMQQFGLPTGPKPQRGTTLKRRNNDGPAPVDASTKINVIKGA
jgi:hypothetical protein